MSYLHQLHPSLVLRRRLSLLADDVVVVVLFVVLHSRIYDVIHHHKANLFDLHSLSLCRDRVKSAFSPVIFVVSVSMIFCERIFTRGLLRNLLPRAQGTSPHFVFLALR